MVLKECTALAEILFCLLNLFRFYVLIVVAVVVASIELPFGYIDGSTGQIHVFLICSGGSNLCTQIMST